MKTKTNKTEKAKPAARRRAAGYGVMAAVARDLGLSRHHVWYVAKGERVSPRVSTALAKARAEAGMAETGGGQ